MISSFLFLLVSTVVLITLRNGKTNQGKLDEREQALRSCLLAVEQTRSEMAVAWVEKVEGQVITYHLPQLDAAGVAIVNSNGDALWGPPLEIALEGEQLTRRTVPDDPVVTPVERRALSRLGPGGTFAAELVTRTLLRITVRSGYGTGYELTRELRLINQS